MKEQFQAILNQIDQSTNDVAARIVELTEKLAAGGMSKAEEEEIYNQLIGTADKLKAIGTEPVPETPAETGEGPVTENTEA